LKVYALPIVGKVKKWPEIVLLAHNNGASGPAAVAAKVAGAGVDYQNSGSYDQLFIKAG